MMTQQRASSVSSDARAGRRAAQSEADAAAAREGRWHRGTDGDLVATSANVRVSTGRTPRTGDGGGDDDDDGGVVMVSVADSGTGTGDNAGSTDGPATGGSTAAQAGTGTALPAPPGPPAPAATAAPPTLTEIYRDREREKKSRLPKFKGLDELKLTVKAWLKAVKNELRRQAAILHTEWCEHEVFFEMVASFEGEALQWFDTVEDSFVTYDFPLAVINSYECVGMQGTLDSFFPRLDGTALDTKWKRVCQEEEQDCVKLWQELQIVAVASSGSAHR
ncbi:hypothetical protein ON010_g13686 [Phytophthora cinnamomi]|nr:hypothetical protein ON010_g13686 [Phytophthora cinnamomi]